VRLGRLLLVGAAVAIGCSHPRTRRLAPDVTRWSATLDSAQRLVNDTQYAAADSLLVAFASSAPPGSPEANEATFWRGVFLLAPVNAAGSVHAAAEAFDNYLESGATEHRSEAIALQRTTRVIDSLSQVRSIDSLPAVHLVVSDDSTKTIAREQEMAKTVKQLQDSLNKTTAELDRIKKRLSTGKP
jgi:hypothetical protein